MDKLIDTLKANIVNPKLWAMIVGLILGAAQITATAAQTELIVGGITAALAIFLPFLHTPKPKE